MNLSGKYKNDQEFIIKSDEFLSQFEKKEIIFWGKGRMIVPLLRYADALNIKYIVDSNKNLHGTDFLDYKILSPERLINEDKQNTRIIIMPNNSQYREISKELLKAGYDKNCFCTSRDFFTAYSYFKKNKIVLPNLEFIITTVCSLKCKHCIAQVPYLNEYKSYIMPFKEVRKNIDNVFKAIDYIGIFHLTTGEVLLHPELDKIIEYISENYRDKYNELTFVTNGTLLPDEKLLKALQKHIGSIQISHYVHPDILKFLKVDNLRSLFNEYGIKHFFNSFATGAQEVRWNDIGDLSLPKNRSERENEELYLNCSMRMYKCMFADKIYPCTASCSVYTGGINELSPGKERVDYVKTTDNPIDIVKFFLQATTYDQPHICGYCNGVGSYINDKLIPAGEQL
ncbi:MAG: radical SAM protein [Proteobacteria bacterium]|nr:radical SAM protein [Pseudomonadota bacterium]